MATSEYIPEKGERAEKAPPLYPIRPGKPRDSYISSLLAPLPMVFGDVMAILLAVCASFALRTIFLDKSLQHKDFPHEFQVSFLL